MKAERRKTKCSSIANQRRGKKREALKTSVSLL
jgi:hypothetical protein